MLNPGYAASKLHGQLLNDRDDVPHPSNSAQVRRFAHCCASLWPRQNHHHCSAGTPDKGDVCVSLNVALTI